MSLLTDLVVTSATVAFAHFGVTLDAPERPAAQPERTVARSQPAQPVRPRLTPVKPGDCPDKASKMARSLAAQA